MAPWSAPCDWKSRSGRQALYCICGVRRRQWCVSLWGALPSAAMEQPGAGQSGHWGMSGKYFEMPAALAVIALVLLALPSRGEEQRARTPERVDERVRIPDGCRELADRAGLPPTPRPRELSRTSA